MRSGTIVLAALLVVLSVAGSEAVAQYGFPPEEDENGPGILPHRLMVTPVLGVRGSLIRDRSLTAVAIGDLVASRFEWGAAGNGGPAVGAEADLRLFGSVGVAALGLYLGVDDVLMLKSVDSRVVSETVFSGPEAWLAAGGISVRLPDAVPGGPAGYIVVGPAWIRQDYGGTVFSVPGLEDRVESHGVWVGYRALFPVGMRHSALSVTLEDVIPIWDREGEHTRLLEALELSDADASAGVRGASHIPMLRVGLSLRL